MSDTLKFNALFIVGSLLIAIFSLMAAGAGIGGGVLFVGIFYLVLRYSSSLAVPLSNFAIFGGAIPIFFVNFRRKNPIVDKPLIDYDIALLAQPMTLAGTTIGVLANVLLPEWINEGLLFLMLVLISYRSTKKAISKYKSESLERKKEKEQKNVDEEEKQTTNSSNLDQKIDQIKDGNGKDEIEFEEIEDQNKDQQVNSHGSDPDFKTEDENLDTNETPNPKEKNKIKDQEKKEDETWIDVDLEHQNKETKKNSQNSEYQKEIEMIEKDEKKIGIKRIILFLIVWLITFLISLLKGGGSKKSLVGVEKCSAAFWTVTFISLPINILITLYVGRMMLNKAKLKDKINYPIVKGDVKWGKKIIIAFSLVCFLNGLVAGMLGAGAGTITSFILVEMKLNPEVLTATSALIVLLASSSTAIQYLLIGLVPYAKGFWFFGVTLICFPIGKLTLNYLVRKYKRAALILFTFAIAITVSAVLMCYNTIDALLHQSHKNKISQFCN
ncbi:sulfite exporter taue/safe [Anaeramoeba ignava]|uniref:Sulfite exporter taue/safe n=1 Tax=Anaeramoeba ignava TaxID=1746090 RepID=A0A9Q0RBG8_ANAIG|nr:sulfite exporter taue/safe [Anaeramoeba ignava]